ncbi:MAG: helix-turn-helix domain-containing protein [Propionibacteriaceae bacterium]
MTEDGVAHMSRIKDLDSLRPRRLVSTAVPSATGAATDGPDALTIGKQLRHRRRSRHQTLDGVAAAAGISGSALSLIETGKREAKISTLHAIARALDSELEEFLSPEPPNHRAQLEIALERAQRRDDFADLDVPPVRPGPRLPLDVLESLVALHTRLAEVEAERDATPEYARRANAELRTRMRASDNYFPEIEDLADELLLRIDHDGGPLTRFGVSRLAETMGFTLESVGDLPGSTRTITDLAGRRIFLPASDQTAQRTLALAALGHIVLGHRAPANYAEFLAQRVEVNYFAAAALVPQRWAAAFLQQAKADKDIEIEDLRDRYSVSYEMAAHRFTNLATEHLDIGVHFMKINAGGIIYKAYSGDGVVFPMDRTGSVEGQRVCRHWTAREVFNQNDWAIPYQQYTDTPHGTFWCTAVAGRNEREAFSVSVGTPYTDVKWFRGRGTPHRGRSRCPDPACCTTPPAELAERWAGRNWPSARVQPQLLSALPVGAFPGVDDTEVVEFLERHSGTMDG